MASTLPAPPPGLAKLTVPEPGRVVARLRLFELLDDARSRGNIVWIAAPAGSGKTTLLASYLRERRLRSAWFQADPADADVASFLDDLAQIAGGGETLPAYTAEYLAGLPAFARRWRTYRRCRDVLASTLQARPSPSTEALLRRLGAETPGLTA